MAIDFAAIAARALAAAENLVSRWLADGKREGAEWGARNPTRADQKLGSFKVNLQTGKWSDFSTGDAGNDLISLYAYLHQMSQGDAANALAEEFGMDQPATGKVDVKKNTTADESEWIWVSPITAQHPPAPRAHSVRGEPSMGWTYRNSSGQPLGYIWRFDTSEGGKDIIPLTLWEHRKTGALKWRHAQFPVPRPLYNLPALNAEGTVLLVEGEKACKAAMAHYESMSCLSWPGGSKAINKVDWSPLAGRRVVLWPDKDEPGITAMSKIAEILRGIGCEVDVIDVRAAFPNADAGFDVADIPAEQAVYALANAMQCLLPLVPPPAKSISTPNSAHAEITDTANDGDSDLFSRSLIWGNAGLKDCRENVIYFLRDHPEWRGVLAADEFAKRIVFRKPGPLVGASVGAEWSTNFDTELALWLAEQRRAKMQVRSLESIGHAVKYVSQLAKFHPVREKLESLTWDRTPRIDRLAADYLGAVDNEYSRLLGRYFLLNMVARIYEPGCIMRSVPVLEGEQNKGKSTALRILAQPWFSDTIFQVNNKDAYQQIQGMWLYEISELESFGRVEATAVKAFISSVEDNFRAPYERANERHKRQTVFAGTTNAKEWLKDWTGNTRFWPLEVGVVKDIDLDGLAKARDQLLAEALAVYRSGERRYPSKEIEVSLFQPEQDRRLIIHPWVERISDWLAMGMRYEVSVNEVLMDCLKVDMSKINPNGTEAQTVGKVMAKLGWAKVRKGSDASDRAYVWRKPESAKATAMREPGGDVGASDVPF